MDNGKVIKVMFGDPNMPIRKKILKLKHHFVLGIIVVQPKDKTTARYWSCREWE